MYGERNNLRRTKRTCPEIQNRFDGGQWLCCLVRANAILLLTGQFAVAAPPALDYFFPAGAQQGQTVTVTAAGKFDSWPVSAWTDRAGLSIVPDTESGQLQFRVAPDARPGRYWVRLCDPQGATALRPFVVGILPERLESEPHDKVTKSQPVSLPATVNGRLEENGDVDAWTVGLRKGQTLVASVAAHPVLGSPMDAVMQICSADGFVLAQNDDFRGLDPQLVFSPSCDGDYVVRLFAFPASPNSSIRLSGNPAYVYRLTLTTSGFLDHSMPLAVARSRPTGVRLCGWNIEPDTTILTAIPQGAASEVSVMHPRVAGVLHLPVRDHPVVFAGQAEGSTCSQPVQWPVTITGRIDTPKEIDSFRFHASQGDKLVFRAESSELGYELDPVLRLLDGDGTELAQADDQAGTRDALLTHLFKKDGEFRIAVGDRFEHGGFRYVYRLTVSQAMPDFALQLTSDALCVATGESLEIPVAVTRSEGFASAIEIMACDLPDGVTAMPVQSVPSDESAKSVKLVLSGQGTPVSGLFRIVGTSSDQPVTRRTARFPIVGMNATSDELWITVTAK